MLRLVDLLRTSNDLMEKVADPTITLYQSEREEILDLVEALLSLLAAQMTGAVVNPPMTDPPPPTIILLH